MSIERDYQYQIRVDGVQLLRGDAHSTGIVFGNLDGRNFVQDLDSPRKNHISWTSHGDWLAYMAAEFSVPLEPGMSIELLNPEGRMLQSSSLGKSIPQEAAADLTGQDRPRG